MELKIAVLFSDVMIPPLHDLTVHRLPFACSILPLLSLNCL